MRICDLLKFKLCSYHDNQACVRLILSSLGRDLSGVRGMGAGPRLNLSLGTSDGKQKFGRSSRPPIGRSMTESTYNEYEYIYI